MSHPIIPIIPIIPALCLLLATASGSVSGAEPAGGAAPATANAVVPPTVDIGAWKVAVTIPKPHVAGKKLDVDLTLTPATPAPKAVRLWVGKADARGSTKVKAEPEAPGAYCVGVDVPDPIPAEAKVWIALEAADGTISKNSVALPAGK